MERLRAPLVRVAVIVAGILSVVPLGFILRSRPRLFFKPLSEDGFYSLSVARNLALGHGLSIDGHELTNGFQPAVTVLDAIAFLDHGNRVVGVRGILLISWLVMIATCVLVALISRDMVTRLATRAIAPWLAVALFLSGRYVLYAFNGLETGGEILMYAVLWRWFQVRGVERRRDAMVLGALLGVLILVRIDGIALVALAVVALVVRQRRRRGVEFALLTTLSAVLVSLPWWVYNQVYFGQLMPTSGRAEASVRLTWSRFPSLVIGVAQDIVPWGYSAKTQTYVVSLVELLIAAGLVVLVLRRPALRELSDEASVARARRGREFAWLAGGSVAVLGVFYFIETNAVWFYGRYLAVGVLVSSIVVVVGCLNRGLGDPRLVGVVLAGTLVIGLAFTFHFDANSSSPYYQNQLALIEAHVPDGASVAAGQSGTIGFFRSNVVNLDGKVNQAALVNRHDIRAYLARHHIEWLCDQPDYVRTYLSASPQSYGWVEVASLHGFQLWHHAATSSLRG